MIKTFYFSILSLISFLLLSGTNSQQNQPNKKYFFTYNLEIGGDFNADGKTDLLSIELLSGKTHEPIKKLFYLGKEKNLIKKYCLLEPTVYLNSSTGLNPSIVSKDCNVNGSLQIINIGDLNGDGGDEVGIILNDFDIQKVDSFGVYTYCNEKWILVRKFELYPTESEYFDIEENLYKDERKYRYVNRNGRVIDIMPERKSC